MGFINSFFGSSKAEGSNINNENGTGVPPSKGRAGIGDLRRSFPSRRCHAGRLEVIRRRCPRCCHRKALSTLRGQVKCSSCGYYIKR